MNDPANSVRTAVGDPSRRLVLRTRTVLLGLLLTAAAARGIVLWVWSEDLSVDRDAYLALAEGLAAGRGYSVHGTELPTAFRPPLYPLLLAATGAGRSPPVLGVVHLMLGTATVWLTYLLGRRQRLGAPLSLFAAALVAFDPLLLRYTSFPMTETLATFLTTALLVSIAGVAGCGSRILVKPIVARIFNPCLFQDRRVTDTRIENPCYQPVRRTPGVAGPRQQILTGLLFGLCVLCRPTVWAFGGLMLVRWIVSRMRGDRATPEATLGERPRLPWLTVMALVLTVAPWVVRNALVIGHPILMTTHGGYTLLLGNNPAFYREVVDQPWGTVWDGSIGDGQAAWPDRINAAMEEAGVTGEVARDRWMRRRAIENIRGAPGPFLRACWLRFRRFWSLTPSGADARDLPAAFGVALSLWFGGIFVLAAIGLVRVLRTGSARWTPAILMLAAFVAVHLVYWSNARMRSPVVPVIALLAARGVSRSGAREDA